jgi:hypothetical protein
MRKESLYNAALPPEQAYKSPVQFPLWLLYMERELAEA